MEDKKNYYTVLYETTYPDSGVISYKPIKAIKGYYDVDNEVFIDGETQEEYLNVNMTIPIFGKNENNILTALNDEMEEYQEEGQRFFAFPIEEDKLLEFCEDVAFKDKKPIEVYEREVRGYFLYSVYDEEIDDNIFYLTDKLEDHKTYNVDVSLDIIDSICDAEERLPNQQLLLVVAGASEAMMEDMDDDVKEYQPRRSGAPKSAEDSIFKPIISDFDPDELEEKVTSEVIGQDHVAKALVSMIYKNKRYHKHDGLKSNMLILGPSGCGKTELVRSVGRNLNIPIVLFDASSASASGYVGNSVTQAIKDLITVCNGDISKAEQGIIVIDEIDKLASVGSDGISKSDVQDELFKMLEGDEITIAADSYREKSFRFNPKNVTFIGIGAAQGLLDEKQKSKNKRSIGFGSVQEKEEKSEDEEVIIEPEDLIKFGLKPELLRRFNIIKVVKDLKKEDLITILKDSKISNLKLYEAAFRDVDNVTLVCEPDVLESIAEKATKEKAGASGLKRVVDDMLQTSVRKIRMLKGSKGELLLTKDTIENPDLFELYDTEGQTKRLVYPPKGKVKALGTKK